MHYPVARVRGLTFMKKVYPDAKAALAGVLKDGMLICAGGFGLCGIPEVLTSGNHGKIAAWRREQAEKLTAERRPDLLSGLRQPRSGKKDVPIA